MSTSRLALVARQRPLSACWLGSRRSHGHGTPAPSGGTAAWPGDAPAVGTSVGSWTPPTPPTPGTTTGCRVAGPTVGTSPVSWTPPSAPSPRSQGPYSYTASTRANAPRNTGLMDGMHRGTPRQKAPYSYHPDRARARLPCNPRGMGASEPLSIGAANRLIAGVSPAYRQACSTRLKAKRHDAAKQTHNDAVGRSRGGLETETRDSGGLDAGHHPPGAQIQICPVPGVSGDLRNSQSRDGRQLPPKGPRGQTHRKSRPANTSPSERSDAATGVAS